jgi:pimeloyl-ACP methyl ester carboxylesterase
VVLVGPQRRAEDGLAVLDDLGVAQAHYVGYSMDGRIGYALAQHWLDRFRSLAIGGAAPYARDPPDVLLRPFSR